MKLVIIMLFGAAFFGLSQIQALEFAEIFEIEYLLNVVKTTIGHRQCGNQKLDPVRKSFFFYMI